MSFSPRPRRPHLDRTEPHRGFAGLFIGTPEPGAPAARPRSGEASEPSVGRDASSDGRFPGSDDVADGVGIGYRLIEEYLRHGQQVAQATWPADVPSLGGASVAPERLLEYTTQVAGLWFEQMRNAFNARPPEPPAEPPGGFTYVAPKNGNSERTPAESGSALAKHWAPIVVLSVDAHQPIELSLDLRPESIGRELVVFDLRTSRGDGPRIEQVTATWLDERRIRLQLRIPQAQPVGAYASVVVDAHSNVPVGTLSLRILSP